MIWCFLATVWVCVSLFAELCGKVPSLWLEQGLELQDSWLWCWLAVCDFVQVSGFFLPVSLSVKWGNIIYPPPVSIMLPKVYEALLGQILYVCKLLVLGAMSELQYSAQISNILVCRPRVLIQMHSCFLSDGGERCLTISGRGSSAWIINSELALNYFIHCCHCSITV